MIAIVGGGIAGLSIGWELAKRGMSVTLLEADTIGSGASGVATSYLEARVGTTLMRLLEREAVAQWPAWSARLEAETGIDVDFCDAGQIRVTTAENVEKFRKDLQERSESGFPLDVLNPEQVIDLEPSIGRDVTLGAYNPDVAWVDGGKVCSALARAIQQRGGRIWEGRSARSIRQKEDGIEIRLGAGDVLMADAVVLANGLDANDIEGCPEDTPKLRAVRGVNLILDGKSLETPLKHQIKHHRGNLCPRADGSLLVGTTYEAGVTDLNVETAVIQRLYAHADPIIPNLEGLPRLGVKAGLRTKTPDGAPVWRQSSKMPRVWFSLGHAGSGFLRAPIIAARLASHIHEFTNSDQQSH